MHDALQPLTVQTSVPHATSAPLLQDPRASQVGAGVKVDPAHEPIPHATPAIDDRHCPSAAPVLAAAQDWQVPPQADSQQTPSAQKPEAQSPPEPHGSPFGRDAPSDEP